MLFRNMERKSRGSRAKIRSTLPLRKRAKRCGQKSAVLLYES